ncbi:MAG: iron ABC transporter permease [Lachnospiraceae bacterium]|nr:iron ABC transporter permease [Lachnospiraceae bacterium]
MRDCPFSKNSGKKRIILSFVILALLLAILFLANLLVGSVGVSPYDIIRILLGGTTGTKESLIIHTIRLPRILAAAVLGGALALSGFLLQTYFNNPIAGPFVLGISSGAKMCVAMVMILSLFQGMILSSFLMIVAAFFGSMLSMGFIILLSKKMKNGATLIICGVMIGYICSAITDIMVTFANDADIVNLHNWSKGSFSGISWGNVQVMVPVVIIAFILTFLQAKPMSAYQQGESFAKSVGVDVRGFSIMMIILSGILSASVTAFAGPISFLGVAAPHLVKRILGTVKPIYMIPASFLGGACFCLLCDLIARTVFVPTEVSISTVTAVLGAPIVIWVMVRRAYEK